MNLSLGQRITHYRKKSNLSQKELAAKLNVTSAAVSQYEKDRREPQSALLVKLAKILNISCDALLGRNHIGSKLQDEADISILKASCKLKIDENKLLTTYRNLNKRGKRKALENLLDLEMISKYRD